MLHHFPSTCCASAYYTSNMIHNNAPLHKREANTKERYDSEYQAYCVAKSIQNNKTETEEKAGTPAPLYSLSSSPGAPRETAANGRACW
ncbi:hypothetical protein RB195_014213 [Necator americanus]|uniref:Uncharacterized protein n=1 Tax=Necator americanus TaxID=51031 RepID=A0ABR1DZ51_NECAM